MIKLINDPKIGSIVKHIGWQQDKKVYPCDVYITDGCYLSDGRLSNFWWWKRVLKDGSLGKVEKGYGSFEESNKNYEIEIRVKRIA
ncbi:MAG TPA: hypothetical protein ENH82_12190 [bacterium]|nr:hypothetical protein [bacterium]